MTETETESGPRVARARAVAAARERGRKWLLVSLGLVTVIAIVDAAVGGSPVLIGFMIVGPLVAATALSPRQTALVGAYVVGLGFLLGIPDDMLGTRDHLARTGVLAAGSVLTVWIAGVRAAHERTAVLLATQGEVGRILTEAPSLSDAAPRILEAIGVTFDWDFGGIWTPDADGRALRCDEVWAADEEAMSEFVRISREIELEPGSGIPGRVWANCAPVWVPDVLMETNFPRGSVAARAGLRGGFGFPIKGSSGCLGAIDFFAHGPRAPDAELLDLMAGLGAQIGQYIERTHAQEVVSESDALKTSILESALDCVITMDGAGRVVEFNPAAEATFGYAREAAVGADMAELIIPPAFRERHRAGLARYRETGDGPMLNRRLELTALRADGTEFPVELAITPIHGEGPPMFTGYLRDITERKRAEEERERLTGELMQAGIDLGRSRNQLEAILEGIADGVTAQDPTGRLVYANEAAVRTLGFDSAEALLSAPTEEILGKFDVLDETGQPFPLERLPGRLALAGERPSDTVVRFRIRETGEERWSIVKAAPILDDAGNTVLAINIFEDISEHKRSEQTHRFLAETSRALVGSLDYETTLQRVAQLVVPDIADWCAVEVGEAGAATHRVAVAHADPQKVALALELRERYPRDPDSDDAVARVLRSGVSELHAEIPDDVLVANTRDEGHLRLLRAVGLRSAMFVPMAAFGHTIGAIVFASGKSGRRFTEADLELAEEIARRAAVAVQNARLYSERSYIARTLQQSLLPPHLPDLPGIEIAARYQAAGEAYEVGGDFYDIFQTGRDSWAAVIGDVRGKGPGAATVTALARYTLRAAAMRETAPSRILAQLNEAMVRQGTEDRFCTVAYASLRPAEDGVTAVISCGGHPMPLVLRSDGSVQSAGTPGTLLGLVPDPDLADSVAQLFPGDALVLYTDGVSEARSDNGLFGEERLVALLQASCGLDATRIVDRIQAQVLEFQDEQPNDDVALLVLRVRDGLPLRPRDEEAEWRGSAPAPA
jgi:PAS domain S-box-containing protein